MLFAAWNCTVLNYVCQLGPSIDIETDAFVRLVDCIGRLVISIIRSSPVTRWGFFKGDLLKQELPQLANDAHLLAKLFKATKLVAKRFFDSPAGQLGRTLFRAVLLSLEVAQLGLFSDDLGVHLSHLLA